MEDVISINGRQGVRQQGVPTATAMTIVIVNWNSGTMLRPCLRSALRLKVVVVDNNSKDGSPELVEREFPEVSLIRSGGNLGFGRGNNLAQAHAQPGYVLFLNPDTELQERALQQMVDFLVDNPRVGAVGCKMVFPGGEVADQNLQWFPNPLTEFVVHAFLTYGLMRRFEKILPLNDPLKSAYVKKLYGGCFMARTAVLEQVGWFDDRFFMYAEDVDLSRRIREAGWDLYYLSEAQVMHVAGGTSSKAGSDFSILMNCESMEKLIRKYQGVLAAFIYRVGLFSASLLRLCFLYLIMLVSRARRNSCREAARNCGVRSRWALGLRSATIPE